MESNSIKIKYTNFLNISELKDLKDDIIKETNIKENGKEHKRLNKIIIICLIKNISKKINIKEFIFFNINYIVFFIFNFLIILNLFNKTINNKFNFYYFKFSKISLRIKGIGTKTLLSNSGTYSFKGLNFIKQIYINGNIQDKVEHCYYFNQTDNFVELIFEDDINNCEFMFFRCTEITEINLSNFKTSQVTSMYDMFAYCSSLTSINLSNIDTSKVESMSSIFAYCSNLTFLNLSNFKTSNVNNMNRLFFECPLLNSLDLSNFNFSKVKNMNNMFENCNNLKYKKKKNCDQSKLYNFIREIDNTHKKISIFLNKIFINNLQIFSLLYRIQYLNINCTNDWLSDNENINDDYEYIENGENSKEKEIKLNDNFLNIIETGILSDKYNTSDIDNGNDKIIEYDKLTITFTTTQNQKNNIYNNMTTIDLGECENLLRNYYNISINEVLYIKKIDIQQERIKTLKVEYDIYAKLFGNNLIKLNLTICKNEKISISIPIIINDDIDKLNSSSGYYNDICYTTTSEDGTDITMKDRQKEFINKDRVLCQENCILSEYNYDTSIAKCSCQVKECAQSFADMSIDKDKLLNNFINIKNFINYKFLKCYKNLFNKKGILNNIGCYLLFIIIFFHIIAIFIFRFKQFSEIKDKIRNITSELYKNSSLKENKKNGKSINNKIKYKKISIHKNYHERKSEEKHINGKKYETKMKLKQKDIKNSYNKKENNVKYIEEEINGFSYNLAKKYDKRTYCQYYISLLKTQHNLICALFNNNDYNSGIIKIDLFLIGFSIDYTINALYYNDDTMHKIYKNKGNFDFETQIPIAVYSAIISTILNTPLNILALSNDSIINFKQNNTKINNIKKGKNLINILIIKFSVYFVISFLFLLFFWYYISIFGVIYRNTHFHLLKDVILSFGLSLIIPFGFYLLPGIFRIPSLSNGDKKREYLYNFSKFLQFF